MNDTHAAIVGMAGVFPGARNLTEFWRNIVNAVDAVAEIPDGRLNRINGLSLDVEHDAHISCRRGGFLPENIAFDPLHYGIMPNIVAHGDPDQFLMLDVAAQALADAGIALDDPVRENTDVIIGRGGYFTNKYAELYLRAEGCERMLQYFAAEHGTTMNGELAKFEVGLRRALSAVEVDSISTCIPNIVASRVANRLNLHGAAYVVDAACASSLLAVEEALVRLRAGMCDVAIAGGIHVCQLPSFWYVFNKLGALSPTSTIRPFDRRADGLVPAEGCGAVVLKRFADACRDGDRVYAVIRGSGSSSDGRDAAVLAPASAGQIRALDRSYRDSRVDPATIGYLEAHGTGTEIGDASEIQTIKAFFGRRGRFPTGRAMGSVKSMIGHAMPAAGIASLIKTALALCHKVLPASLHCEEPHTELHDAPFFLVGETRPWIHQSEMHPRRAGVNAFGFGGSNVHLVLEEVTELPTPQYGAVHARTIENHRTCETELVAFSGATCADVLANLGRLEEQLPALRPCASLADVTRTLTAEFDNRDPVKLVCICRDLAELKDALPSGREILTEGKDCFNLNDWYFTTHGDAPRGKIACIFPGLGFPGLIGNYPDHLMELCLHFPEVREQFDAIELRDRHPDDPVPTSIIFAPPHNLSDEDQALLRERIAPMKVIEGPVDDIDVQPIERNIAASGITVTNWVSWILLEKLGIPAHMLCGQSQGEMAALCASGVLEVGDIIPRFWEAMAISPKYAGKGRLAFVHATEAQLNEHLDGLSTVSVAIHVAPQALVIGGEDSDIDVLMTRLRDQQILAQALPYPPIHTPQLNYLRDELMQLVNTDMDFRTQQIPVYSAITENIFPGDPNDIRMTALANLDQPVRFWQTIARMYDDGARIFIQVGGGSLAANIKSVLERPDIVGAAVDVDYRDPITQLNHLCATLLTAGVPVDLQRLLDHRPLPAVDWRSLSTTADSPTRNVPLRFDWAPFEIAGRGNAVATTGGATDRPSDLTTNGLVSPQEAQPTSLVARTAEAANNDAAGDDSSAIFDEAAHRMTVSHERRMPFINKVLEHTPGERLVVEHILDINEDLYLRDHTFINAQDVKPVERCLPVMPLTVILEAMAEAAACLAPGCGVIGFENVTAQRWVALEDVPSMPIRIEAERLSEKDGIVRIATSVSANDMLCTRAVVRVAGHYQHELSIAVEPFVGITSWPFEVEEVYRDGHLFHGPLFQCITGLFEFAENGGTAELTVQPADRLFASCPNPELVIDPVIFDSIGQVVGLWAAALGTSVLPSGVEKIEIYRPTPLPGTRIRLHVWVTDVETRKRLIKSHLEAVDEEGQVWFRVAGWKDWLYRYPKKTHDFRRMPRTNSISDAVQLEPLPPDSVCRWLSRGDLLDVTITWLEKLFLSEIEIDEFRSLKIPKRQWDWILGRVAAKDAVRLWQAQEVGGDQLLHPATITIAKDQNGRPFVRPTVELPQPPLISISHSGGKAIAVASRAAIGVDYETELCISDEVLSGMCTATELDEIGHAEQEDPQGAWPTRLWTAKEAASKAIGAGFGGAPQDFVTVDWLPEGQFLIQHEATGERMIVYTKLHESGVLAHSVRADGGDGGTSTVRNKSSVAGFAVT